jgi:hypothetical protein
VNDTLQSHADTRKFKALVENPNVAILLHDFGGGGAEATNSLSVTLYGTAHVCEAGGEQEARLRSLHLARNPSYRVFIEGEDIAVLAVQLSLARMCDTADKVTCWEAGNSTPKRVATASAV